jgi:hypothetical protein
VGVPNHSLESFGSGFADNFNHIPGAGADVQIGPGDQNAPGIVLNED